MARFKSADARLFEDVWICMSCNAKNRGNKGKSPAKCRKCGNPQLRKKRKDKKA